MHHPPIQYTAFWVAEHDAHIKTKRNSKKEIDRPPRPKFSKMHDRSKNQNVKITVVGIR